MFKHRGVYLLFTIVAGLMVGLLAYARPLRLSSHITAWSASWQESHTGIADNAAQDPTQLIGMSGLVANYRDDTPSNNATGDLVIIRALDASAIIRGSVATEGNNSEVVVSPNGEFAIAYPTGNSGMSVSVITGLTQSIPVESQVVRVDDVPVAVAITADNTTAIVVNSQKQGPVTYRIITGLPGEPSLSHLYSIPTATPTMAEDVVLSPEGNTAIISLSDANQIVVIDNVRVSPTVRGPLNVGRGPNGVAIAPDGQTAFVANMLDNSIEVITGLAGGTLSSVNRLRNGVGSGPQAIQLTPDGSKALVTNSGGNTLSVFEVLGQSLSLLATVTVGHWPAGLAVSSDGQFALVGNSHDRTVSVIRGLNTRNRFISTTMGPSPALDTADFGERTVAITRGGEVTPPSEPSLNVTPTSLIFNDVVNQGNAPSQSFTVENIGAGSMSFSITSSNPDLVITSPTIGTLSGNQSTSIQVTAINPNIVGTQFATLTVNAPGALNTPQVVNVTVITTAGPALNVLPLSLIFNDVVGQGNAPSQSMTVQNIGGGLMTFTITSSNPGLVITAPTLGTLLGNQSTNIQVTAINPNIVGTQLATLTVSAPGSQNSPQLVNVTVITTAGPALGVSPLLLIFNDVVNQGNAPSQPVTVQNTGGGLMAFTIISSSPGLVITAPTFGTLSGNQSTNIQVTAINPNIVGTQFATLTVTAPGAQSSPQLVTVTVITTAGPALSVLPLALIFNDVVGQGNAPSQTVTVGNAGGGLMTYTITSSNPGLVITAPTFGALFGNQSNSIQVTAINPNIVGTQFATLTVNAPGAQSSPQVVNVTVITVAAPPQLQPLDLGAAADFVILAGSTITNTGPTIVTGDLGLSPGSALTGFPPGVVFGTQHLADPIAATAKLALTAAYNDAAGRSTNPILVAGNIGGQTLPPGLYKANTTLAISSGDLTLDAQGNPNAVWIFQIGSTFTMTPGRMVILSGGAQAKNIFWQVGTSATLGPGAVFKGTILADQSISLLTGATVVDGRLLTRIAAVTLDSNIVTIPGP